MIKKIAGVGNFLLERTFLSRIKVFHQILILIIMVVFLWIQGNKGLEIISNMHKRRFVFLIKTYAGRPIFPAPNYTWNKLKSDYLAILAGESNSKTVSYEEFFQCQSGIALLY